MSELLIVVDMKSCVCSLFLLFHVLSSSSECLRTQILPALPQSCAVGFISPILILFFFFLTF